MTRTFVIKILALFSLLFVVACGASTTIEREPAAVEVKAAVAAEDAGSGVQIENAPPGLEAIGNSGKPQFINSFAVW